MLKRLVLFVQSDRSRPALSFMTFYDSGYVVHWSRDLSQAETLLRAQRFDVVLIDIHENATTVGEFCRRIKHQRPNVKILWVTRQTDGIPTDALIDAAVPRPDFEQSPLEHLKRLA